MVANYGLVVGLRLHNQRVGQELRMVKNGGKHSVWWDSSGVCLINVLGFIIMSKL